MRRANELFGHFARGAILGGALIIGFAFTAPGAQAEQFSLSVVDQDGNNFNGFRYLVQEDCMFRVDPQAADPTPDGEQAFNFHKSHCHAIKKGNVAGGFGSVIDLGDLTGTGIHDCFVSVLPNVPAGEGVQTGGAKVPGCTTNTTVVVPNGPPFQTAQISVKVFQDGFGGPLNNAPDIGEPGIPGFSVLVEDAGGQVQQDAFGNPLGTTYQMQAPPNDDEFVIVGGLPVVQVLGTGEIKTPPCAPVPGDCTGASDGEVVIKFLAPGKYAIRTVEPTGQSWYQTTTIEGTNVVDAWVAPGNGDRLVEFGPAFWHIFNGWTPTNFDRRADLGVVGGSSVSGHVNKSHLTPPPAITGNDGGSFIIGQNGVCLVGLNTMGGVSNEGAIVAPCDADGNFTIGGVADGLYQLVVWDTFLHAIISFQTVEIVGNVDIGEVQVPMWFGELTHQVYNDTNENAIWDGTELPFLEQATILHYRDGTEYQAFPTDGAGAAPYESVFPLFQWYVAEVDFARYKATGLTAVNDLGGDINDPQCDANSEGVRCGQTTTERSYALNETEGGPILTQAFQLFAGQNLRFDWGKSLWGPGENGGLSGIVFYATTRAEDNPEQYGPEPWEPGIPHVQVALFVGRVINPGAANEDERPFNINGIPGIQQPDQDNWPLGNFPGPEDINRCNQGDPDPTCNWFHPTNAGDLGYSSNFDYGDAVDVAWTDSWDDNLPTGCSHALDPALGVPADRCMDGLPNWNQIKGGVFDGGYAFGAGGYTNPSGNLPPDLAGTPNFVQNNFTPAAAGHLPGGSEGYVVQVYPPRARTGEAIYKVSRSQDKNVDFGPNWTPSTAALPEGVGRCTGGEYTVPAELSLFPGVEAPLAGQTLRLCNQRFQFLADAGQAFLANNSAANFYLHTDVPLAAKAIGQITDDLANELAAGKPTSTEKFAPPFLNLAFFDYTGREIVRGYSSEFSKYNFLLPSTVSQSLPIPSGISPMMTRFCINHPGPLADGTFPDPNYDSRYSTTCYTFDFMPGKVTYLDTPVIRLAAFVGPLQAQTDCAVADATPVINNVTTSDYAGPVLSGDPASKSITILSQGLTQVPDPSSGNQTDTITRDFGFGFTEGTVSVVYEGGQYTFPITAVNWGDNQIDIVVPTPAPAALQTGQLVVTHDNGRSTETGVTLHVGVVPSTVSVVSPGPNQPIQAAVDAASDGDLILVTAGLYDENVIVYREVIIQGAGAPSTQMFAAPFSLGAGTSQLPGQSDKLQAWKDKLAALVNSGDVGVLPGQVATLPSQTAPGFLVMPPDDGTFTSGDGFTAQIDGFNIQGANLGGAVFVNAYADGLTVSNNKAIGNLGQYGGGIRVGNPLAGNLGAIGGAQNLDPADLEGVNPNITIAHNEVVQNSSFSSGGGIAIYTGADNYEVSNNLVCGNFSRTGGGGIAQLGRVGGLGSGGQGNGNPEDGVIRDNVIIFNEVFQGNEIGGGGGGIELAGEAPAALGTILTEGTGSITIDRNLFHGNLGGAAPGGAISLKGINGEDVTSANGNAQSNQRRWHRILVLNNLIQNNVSGQWGAGISLSDAVRTEVIHNTLARNDNASVAANVRSADPNLSDPQPSGLVAEVHSAGLALEMGTQTAVGNGRRIYSHPAVLKNNIFNRNRSYWLDKNSDPTNPLRPLNQHPVLGGIGNSQWDLGVVGVPAACMRVKYSLLARTGADTPDACNYDGVNDNNVIALGAGFVGAAFNDLVATTAADEGGNDTQLLFTPLTKEGIDYHINPGSNAVGVGQDLTSRYGGLGTPLAVDVDAETRPSGLGAQDAGADQVSGATGPVNNPPTAVNDNGADGGVTSEGVPVVIPVLTNDSDPDAGDVISVSQITTQPGNGTVDINGDGTVTYRPYGGFVGGQGAGGAADCDAVGVPRELFTYEIEDSGSLTDTANVRTRVNCTALVPETVTPSVVLYRQNSGLWLIRGDTTTAIPGATVEITLHRNGALIVSGEPIDREAGTRFNTGEIPPADPLAVAQPGDHVIIRTMPNNRTADGVVQIVN